MTINVNESLSKVIKYDELTLFSLFLRILNQLGLEYLRRPAPNLLHPRSFLTCSNYPEKESSAAAGDPAGYAPFPKESRRGSSIPSGPGATFAANGGCDPHTPG